MKEEIFEAYVKKVCQRYRITEEELFSKNKRGDLADARFLLYFLCYNRPMRIRYIVDYMKKRGYSTPHSSVINGIREIAKKVDSKDGNKEYDEDYHHIIRDIERSVIV